MILQNERQRKTSSCALLTLPRHAIKECVTDERIWLHLCVHSETLSVVNAAQCHAAFTLRTVTPYEKTLMMWDSTGCGHSDDHDVRWHTLVAHFGDGITMPWQSRFGCLCCCTAAPPRARVPVPPALRCVGSWCSGAPPWHWIIHRQISGRAGQIPVRRRVVQIIGHVGR